MSSDFVFYDPTGKRWNRFRRFFGVGGVCLVTVLIMVALALVSNPQLPALGLPAVEHLGNTSEVRGIIRGERAARNTPFKARTIKYVRQGGSPVLHQKAAAKVREDQPLVWGFFVNWDPASLASLRINLSHLTHLVPEWLTLANAKGDVDDASDETVIKVAKDANLPIIALITNFKANQGWQGDMLARVLANPGTRHDLVENILSNIHEHHFAGINVDFEQLPRHGQANLVVFMQELYARLHPEGLLVTESVPVDDTAYDLKRLGAANDYIVPMLYDEHYQSGEPGPVASEGWFLNQIEQISKLVPPEKIVGGIGNYGYDWVIGGKGATERTFGDVISSAQTSNAQITWDKAMENPVLRYTSPSGQHETWFLDAVTALNQIQDLSDAGFRGYAVWRLGGEDPGIWNLTQNHIWPPDDYSPVPLFHLTANKSVLNYGDGDIIRVTKTPQDGNRNVWKDSDDDYEEQYLNYPSYFVVERSSGSTNKVVTLSFDDGPSSQYTPEVLDVLKQKGVPAAFFVIGLNAEVNPGLLKRMWAEGHVIGNHTYSHPNVAKESAEATKLELNTTLRLIEHTVGRATKLFRPPYNADSEPATPEEIVPIERAQDMGYVTVAETIDPQDWRPGVTADQIVNDVVDNASDGKIILLHDAGGSRAATVEALPLIIDRLRAEGFQFIGLPQLMNRSRDELMPVPSASEKRWATVEGQALVTKGSFLKVIGLLFLIAIYLTLLRSLTYGALAVSQKRKAAQRKFDPSFQPGVSVVIAAYNEEKVIVRTVQSILDNGYPNLEVIVVDDGSKDATFRVLHDNFSDNPKVRIYGQANQGKAEALNHAIAQAKCDILVALDADTIFRAGTIGKLVRHFSDEKVGAVSGNAFVGNAHKWITRFQSIEYICGFNLDRRALDRLNAITVVPGAVGAWRKNLIDMVGGFTQDTLAEDTDITLALRRLGYQIRYEEEAVAYTEAPETTRALAKQRFRWAFGTLQAAWKHRDATFNPNYGYLGMVALPSIWIFQVLLAALSPFAELSMIIALIAGNWHIVLLYYFGLFLLELVTALLAYGLEEAKPYPLALLLFQRIYYRQLMYYVLFKSLIFALRGRLVGWGKLERTASVRVG